MWNFIVQFLVELLDSDAVKDICEQFFLTFKGHAVMAEVKPLPYKPGWANLLFILPSFYVCPQLAAIQIQVQFGDFDDAKYKFIE